MASTYLRPSTTTKRVKLVLTCDNCKDRKVKCDKERPECGTCRKTRRPCSYNYADRTVLMRDQQGLSSLPDSTSLQNQLNYLQGVQFGQLFDETGFLAMATRVPPGVDVENFQISGMLTRPLVTVQPGDDTFGNYDGTSVITTEVLQNSINIASNIQRPPEQCQYDPTYFINQADFAALIQQVPKTSEDSEMNDLTLSIENLRLYESTRYVGEGSLLMLDDNNDEMIIPLMPEVQDELKPVDDSLKYLPNIETVEQLINLYFKHVHRYFPALRVQVIWDALQNLSKPQHLLLLNCIFFVASPFHDDPDKQDGKIYFDRAEGAAWSYHGIATKMLFELGLHRKYKNLVFKMEEVERLRNEAFWMTFISENFVSTTYGRPNMIDETDCNISVPQVSYDSNLLDDNARLEIAYINLINLSRICARVRKYLHAASRLRFLMQDDQNKFQVLDAALASWLHALPQWLKFDEIVRDPNGTLLNGIGGDMHIFFCTILILLHGRYLRPPDQYPDVPYSADSLAICMQRAIIIVHCLEILLSKYPEFFALAVSGPFAINPAKRVFIWHARYDLVETEDGTIRKSENCRKSEEMLMRLEVIENQISRISRRYDRGRIHYDEGFINDRPAEWLGMTQHRKKIDRNAIVPREWESFIADDDKATRKQYSVIAKKQSGPFMPKRQNSGVYRSTNGNRMHSSSSLITQPLSEEPMNEPNFIFKTDRDFQFSAFQQSSSINNNMFQDDQFHSSTQPPLPIIQDFSSSPLQQSQSIQDNIDQVQYSLDVKPNNDMLRTPPQSARLSQWPRSNDGTPALSPTLVSATANVILTPPPQSDLYIESNDFINNEGLAMLQNSNAQEQMFHDEFVNENNGIGYDDNGDSIFGLGISVSTDNYRQE
ncbi:19725_t:CDS:2 [Racocetra persica]|uniref:19725_t:CDS:1 n=1 Tax=Racocetra persica TaxID=160502 RepID=A0ACA9L839_9GLOM|nr:19725_t:CDS:2 [Racocetra persica]